VSRSFLAVIFSGERSHLTTSLKGLLNDFLSGPASRSNDE
jgi:hypothetical protein